MRALAIVALAGCFSPKLTERLPCAPPDDWCPPPQMCMDGVCRSDMAGGDAAVDADLPPANLVFTSSESFVAGIRSTPDIIDAADKVCDRLGNTLRSGTYMAWLGTPQMDGAARLATQVSATAGWARPDGETFARSLDELMAGTTYYPPRIDDTGADVISLHGAPRVLTQLPALPNDCVGGGSVKTGAPDAEPPALFDQATTLCANEEYLYCFETDRTDAPPAPVRDANLLYAFVIPGPFPLDSGIDTHDMECNNAGNVPGRMFKAFLAPLDATANSRFTPSTKAWTRTDGVVIANPTLERFEAPLSETPSGTRPDALAVFGAPTPVDIPGDSANCTHWKSNGGSVVTGFTKRSDASAFQGANFDCGTAGYFYCLETP